MPAYHAMLTIADIIYALMPPAPKERVSKNGVCRSVSTCIVCTYVIVPGMQAQPLFRSLLVSVQKLTDLRIETGIEVKVSHVDPDLCHHASANHRMLANKSIYRPIG